MSSAAWPTREIVTHSTQGGQERGNEKVRRLLVGVLVVGLLLVLVPVGYLALLAWAGSRATFPPEGTPVAQPRPVLSPGGANQILFGDLHVHTVYSADAHLQSGKIRDRIAWNPPADACDFARFCSQLDFWSINDHAESLTPDLWRRTVDAVRQCDAAAGDPANPDLVSFLGWEWSHSSLGPEDHYGHKNVVLRHLDEGRIPPRPISSRAGGALAFHVISLIAPFVEGGVSHWGSYYRYAQSTLAVEDCPAGVPTRDLPDDCREVAPDPTSLFRKLDEWGHPALVIPHGLSWGTTNPAHADLANQIDRHDPRWQRLLEVYSGHGNSEIYRDFTRARVGADGTPSCPEATEDFEPCCQRAARLARARCAEPGSEACEEDVRAARDAVAAAGPFSGPDTGFPIEDGAFGACGQLLDTFLPAFDYRPRQSAQYAYALATNEAGASTDARLRWGMIGSSDNHRSRPGTGYREFARHIMTDGVGYPLPEGLRDGRNESYYYTGGLAAVHASGRDRGAVFDGLHRREVYGTSGDRILLWFDLLEDDGTRRPMGSEVATRGTPRFEVRAVGAWEQKPGCPDFVEAALSPERMAELCQGHCYHPGERRKRIDRIEAVRIRPQTAAGQPIAERIDDPWKTHVCEAEEEGCTATFADPAFATETVYYVRALQEPTPAVNGNPMACNDGGCERARLCGVDEAGLPEDCLAAVQERAWSSPIFVSPAAP